MKTLIVAVVLIMPAIGRSQGFLPRWEMSASVDMNSVSNSFNSNDNHKYVSLAFRPGFYPILGQGFSIEPELFVSATEGQSPAINLSGNLCYSLGMGYWVAVPFVLVGYGLGDGIPFYQPLTRVPGTTASGISLYNLGAGVKVMTLGGRGLLRVEYRYQQYSASAPFTPVRLFARHILLGFSILL
jgi:hypothetical protein